LDFAQELGAEVLINYKEQDFAEIVNKETAGPELKVSLLSHPHRHAHVSSSLYITTGHVL